MIGCIGLGVVFLCDDLREGSLIQRDNDFDNTAHSITIHLENGITLHNVRFLSACS